jgi:hypothetical protein
MYSSQPATYTFFVMPGNPSLPAPFVAPCFQGQPLQSYRTGLGPGQAVVLLPGSQCALCSAADGQVGRERGGGDGGRWGGPGVVHDCHRAGSPSIPNPD